MLLKNDGRVLPLSKMTRRVHVAGRNADDLGNQCGGWTISWQGSSGAITTGGTTILQAIRAAVQGGASVTYAVDGSGAAGADVGVVVIGETPYAEGAGDRSDLSLSAADVAAVQAVKRAGVPVVVVLVSGRPLILDAILGDADAIVAAWLPGTEGTGVADVLFGDYAPTGKLSHSWPRAHVAAADQLGRRGVRPAVPLRLRSDVLRRRIASVRATAARDHPLWWPVCTRPPCQRCLLVAAQRTPSPPCRDAAAVFELSVAAGAW